MQQGYQNKQMVPDHTKGQLEEYHFAGGGEYEPISIEASSYDEALKIWEKKRVKVGGEQELKSN